MAQDLLSTESLNYLFDAMLLINLVLNEFQVLDLVIYH